jgi:hypothetical protein
MIYRFLADLVLVAHAAFIIFAVAGAFLVLRWRWVAWLHVPTALWAVCIEFFGWYCPLTPLENHFRHAGGEQGYTGGFVEHYVTAFIYPDGLTRGVQFVLGALVLAVNIGVYTFVLARARRRPARDRTGKERLSPGRSTRAGD